MVILKNKNNGMYYLILSKNNNIIEVVNINDNRDYFYFKLDEEACPFIYYRIISVEEFEIYKNKIQDIKNIAASFD